MIFPTGRLWHLFSTGALVHLVLACAAGMGCSLHIDPNVPEPIRLLTEPKTGRRYQLYRPSSYDRRQAWPLIVVCHTSRPDSPNRRIRDWTQLAEEFGFLVVAPQLVGTRKTLPPSPDKQLPLQRADEELILAAITHVRAGHNVSDDRVFIHGFSGGAYAALHVGLRHPEIFRAINLAQPKFNSEYLTGAGEVLDPYQPIYVSYSVSDFVTGKHARRCVDWIGSHTANLRQDPSGSSRRADCRKAVEFFQRVIRTEPWIVIRAFPVDHDNPLETGFKLRSSYQPSRYRWEFGDGRESAEAQPVHAYAQPGTYRVTLTVNGPKGRPHLRTVTLNVPAGQARPASYRPAKTP